MAQYKINGSTFAVDDAQTGEQLNTTLTQLADYTASQNQQKFLSFLGKSEGADYGTIVGGRQTITDFTAHPNIVGMRTKEGPSTAAGRYQITGTTYREMAPSAGVTDFSPASQDKVALALIARRGAMDDVTSGNFNGAIAKLGKEWASLPSSTYSQAKRSQQWVDEALGQPFTPTQQAGATAPGYKAFGTVVQNMDQAKLSTNSDWLAATRQVYSWKERKQFTGNDEDLAEYGKSIMGYFNNNVVAMTADAAGLVQNGTQDDKNAFLHLMEQYDATNVSWAGTGRAALGMITDPTNLVGIGTLGTATVGKMAASVAAKEALKKTLLTSLGRTGIQAGILGGAQGAVTNTIKQGVEVTAGKKEGIDLGESAVHTALGVAAGLALGTAADALLTVAAPAVKNAVGKIGELVGLGKSKIVPEVPKTVSVALKEAEAAVSGKEAITLKGAATETPKVEPLLSQGEAPKALDLPPAPPTDTLPLPTSFTDEELKAIGTRGQKGRLWTDDLPQDLPINGHPASQLVIPPSVPGLRATVRNMAELTADGEKVAAQLRKMPDSDLNSTLEVLRNSTTMQDMPTVFRAVQILHDESRVALAELMKKIEAASPDNLAALLAQKESLETRMVQIQLADDAMGSAGGSLNRQRQEGLVGLQGSTPESIMKEMGLSKQEAEKFWQDLVDASQVSSKAKQIAGEYDQKIALAVEQGNYGEAGKLLILKGRELAGIAEEAAPGGSVWRDRLHTFAGGLKELMISNLFTIKTVLINAFPAAIKTLSIPLAKYLVTNPLEKAAMAELGAHYSAMGATVKGAFQAARAAYRYEQSILTRDASRLLEGEMVMTGKLGGGLRFFPRILNATDEFLSQVNYAGFVSGKAANKAAIEGTAKGLTGKALKDFIGDAVTAAKGTMYEAADESLVQPIINKGVNLGYSGDVLIKYVETEALKTPEALRHGSDKEALDFVRDVLYKRAFSGDSSFMGASSAAKSYETFVHKNPSASLLVGQLFFRTPIRVFEEGMRMTPGIQILAPRFLSDLRGVNGQARQVRAQAESMMGLALTGTALALYSSGAITGSGSYANYKQDKTRKDGPAPEPYSIRLSDGSTWSFKNMDPISTPLKVLINAFEGMDQLKIKEAQEGFAMLPEYRLLQARVYVGVAALTSAISDASLVSGLKGTADLFAEMNDPAAKEDAILKKTGSMLAMLVPNTLHKIAQTNDPRMRDPSTFFQVIEAKLGHGLSPSTEVKSAFAYDPLGQVRSSADIGSMWNIFSTASQEERNRGHSEAHQQVMLGLDKIANQTGATFIPPSPKNHLTGELDLRTMLTLDKSETLYDKWQRNYRDLKPDEKLLPIIKSGAPMGTFKEKGLLVDLVQSEMKSLQSIAFDQLLTDERVRERLVREMKTKARADSGLLDFDNVNK